MISTSANLFLENFALFCHFDKTMATHVHNVYEVLDFQSPLADDPDAI